jgi:hypothetical protein
VLGPRFFPLAGRWYRRIFVDLDEVVRCLPPLPSGALVLDVGGGDGEIVNRLLRQRPDLRIVMLDRNPRLGGSLDDEARRRVVLKAGTSLSEYRGAGGQPPDAVLISDVVHHVPVGEREAFFADVRQVLGDAPALVIVKDVEPGHFISWLSLMADRYVSGDRQVALVSQDEVERLAVAALPGFASERTALLARNPPNYCSVFRPAPPLTAPE